MLEQRFIDWLKKQKNISEQTKKNYLHSLYKVCDKSGCYKEESPWDFFSAQILNLIEKYESNTEHNKNDVSAMKKFNEFLYETEYVCGTRYIENPRHIMNMLSWFPGSETEAPEIRTSCNNGEDDLLTPSQVARYVGVTTKALRDWRIKGLYLSYLDLPQGVRYQRQVVNALLKRRFHEALIKK